MIFMIFFIFSLISLLMLMINFMISKKMFNNREKLSSFECGFDPISTTRIPFSIQFFLISLIFLIFDIEITLLIPLIFKSFKFNFFMILSLMLFLFILIVGLLIEFLEQSIDWKNS